MRTVTSELLKIKGVGPEKRRALLNAFGSVQGVRDAGAEAIAQLPGFSAASAQRLLAALAPQSDCGPGVREAYRPSPWSTSPTCAHPM